MGLLVAPVQGTLVASRSAARTTAGAATILAVGAVVLATGLLHSLAAGLNAADEAYFLQIVHRVLAGEVLYRDVYFPATPLSVYMATALAGLFGTEVVLLKVVAAGLYAAVAMTCLRLDRQLGGSAAPSIALVCALILSHPGPESLYTPLSMLLLAVSVSAAVASWDDTGVEGAALAGLAAGLAFGAKQNVGLLALGAAWLVLALSARGRRAAALLAATLTWTASVLVVLFGVWVSGAFPRFLEYGFTTKDEYLRTAAIGYGDTVWAVGSNVWGAASWRELGASSWDAMSLMPAFGLVAVALAAALGRRHGRADDRRRLAAAATFAAAALAATYPRMDIAHLVHAAPAAALAAVCAGRLLLRRWPSLARPVSGVCGAVAVLFLFAGVASSAARWESARASRSPRDNLRGVPVPVPLEQEMQALQTAAARRGATEQWFHLSPRAGLYYLVTDQPNATPFDYPVMSALGRDGATWVEAEVSAGRLSAVCVDHRRLDRMQPPSVRPLALEAFVRRRLPKAQDLGACTLYQRAD